MKMVHVVVYVLIWVLSALKEGYCLILFVVRTRGVAFYINYLRKEI